MSNTEEWPGAGGGRRLQPFASFRYRNYRWLWAANLTYGALQGTQGFAIAWLIIEGLDGSYNHGVITLMMALPVLLVGLPAGKLADRRDRRLLLIASHLVAAALLLLTAILAAADVLSLALFLVMVFVTAAGLALGQPVRLALIPALVPKERILNANALDTLGQLLGALIAAGLQYPVLRFLGVEVALVLLAIVVGAGALLLIPLRVPPREPLQATEDSGATAGSSSSATMRSDIVEGFRFLWRTIELRMLFVLLLTAMLVGPWLALELTGERLDLDAFAQAFLNFLLAVATFVTAVVLTAIPRVRNAGLLFGLAIVIGALLTMAVSVSPFYVLTALLMSVSGLALGFRWLIFATLVQSHTPIGVMGRVMGIYVTLTAGAGLLAPPITRAGRAGLQDDGWIVFAGIVLVGIVAFVLVRNPGLRRMPSHPEPVEPGEGEEEAAAQPG